MICSIIAYLFAYTHALFSVVHVYLLGVFFVLYEFYIDCLTGLKTTQNEMLFKTKNKQWARRLSKMRRKILNEEEEMTMKDEGKERRKLVAVVTGANGTIGSEILRYLLALNFHIFTIGRHPPSSLHLQKGNSSFIKCDLSNLDEVFSAISTIQLATDCIDLLILNAGFLLSTSLGWLPYRKDLIGAKIVERHLAVNVLANAQLFASLSSRMEKSSLREPRVIFVSSCAARAGDLSLLLKKQDELFWCRHLNGYKAYADSKLLLSAYVQYLNRVLRSRGSRIAVASVHPGVVPGRLYRNVFWPFRFFINTILAPFMRTPLHAATQILKVAFAEPSPSPGAYYENGVPVHLKALKIPEDVWIFGRCVREMIVDNDESNFSASFLSCLDNSKNAPIFDGSDGENSEALKEEKLERSTAGLFDQLMSKTDGRAWPPTVVAQQNSAAIQH